MKVVESWGSSKPGKWLPDKVLSCWKICGVIPVAAGVDAVVEELGDKEYSVCCAVFLGCGCGCAVVESEAAGSAPETVAGGTAGNGGWPAWVGVTL